MEPEYRTDKIQEFYSKERKLGEGGFGATYLCTQISTGLQYACKCISKERVRLRNEDVAREIRVMYSLREHPNIVTLHRVYVDTTHFYLVMEACLGGDLLSRINQQGFFAEAKAKRLMHAIIGIVETCHEAGVVHLDLKPENLVFSTDAVVKCIDFGAAKFFEPGQVFEARAGTPAYMAPEVWNRCYGQEADIWSAGVVLYMMLGGARPFTGAEVVKGKPPKFEDPPWPEVSEDAKDLIRKMLSYDRKVRPTASEVLKHPWMLELPPTK